VCGVEPYRRDVLAASVLAAVLVPGTLFVALLVNSRQEVPHPDITPVNLAIVAVLTTAGCGTVAFRRRRPRLALAVATGLVVTCAAIGLASSGPGIGLVVCAYSLVTVAGWRRAAPVLAALAAVHATGGVLAVRAGGRTGNLLTYWGGSGDNVVAMGFASAASFGIPAAIGVWVRRRHAQTAALTERAERLEAERAERDAAAAAEERARIARELHDIAAHDLSAIVVQAGAADRLVDGNPAAAKAVLRDIRGQGRQTLAALRQLVGIMRDSGGTDVGGRAPQPGRARIGDLVALARAAGMAVDAEITGVELPVPAQVDLAVYRVVQESLSNARQHAPGAAVTVHVSHDGDSFQITVRNGPSRYAPRADPAGGHGLAGMRERVRQAGGRLALGPTPDGGWFVHATLPVPSTVEEVEEG